MGLRNWLHGNTGSAPTAPAPPDFKARAAHARALHAEGRMSLNAAVKHMTGQKSVTWISAPDADGFMQIPGFSSSQLDEAISASTWFYACVVANARAASDLPPVVQVQDVKGEWQRDRDHPLNDLLAVPFGDTPRWPRWSWKQLTQTCFMQLPGCGNAFLKPSIVTDTPTQQRITALFPIMKPGAVQGVESPIDGLLDGWRLGNGTEQIPLNSLVNIMTPTAGSLWDGISPMGVASNPIETDAIAASRQRWNMENRISHGLIITITDAWGMGATDDQEAAILEKLETDYQEAAADGKPIILGGGAKIEAPPTAEELQVFETRKFSRDEIMAVCGTPPPMIGDYESATLQNFGQAFMAWWDGHLFPMNHDYYGAINSQAVWPIYGTTTRIWYDVSRTNIGVRLMDAKLDVAKKILDLGHTANTAAAEVGLDLEFVEELETYNRDLAVAGRPDDPAVTEPAEGAE